MLNDGKQIAAARQLLDWSQTDLAEKSGVSKPSIIRMEKDLHSVKDELRMRVLDTFAKDNIEFIEGGTRINQKIVQIIEGDDCYVRLMDQAYLELANNKGEILFSGSDETRSPNVIIQKFNFMRAASIKMRSLICHGDAFVMGHLNEYRWMDVNLFSTGDVKVIFGNKVAYLMSWHKIPRVILIEDKNIADENKRLFEYIWSISPEPPHTIAKTRYIDVKN